MDRSDAHGYLDAGHPLVRATAATLIGTRCRIPSEVGRICYYVRDVPYDVLASRYLAQGQHPPATLITGSPCSAWARQGLLRRPAAEPPVSARIAFQTIDAPDRVVPRYVPREAAGRPSRGTRWVRHILVGDGSSWTPSTHPPPPASARRSLPARIRRSYPDPDGGRGTILRENGSYRLSNAVAQAVRNESLSRS